MMPSLYGVVSNIKKLRSNRMALAAGCTLTMAAMIVVPSVVQAYGEQMVYDGSCEQYNPCDQNNGYGGDYSAYSDGSYGGYPVGDYQSQNEPDQLTSSPTYGLNTPFYYNGMWNSQPTPSPAPADLQSSEDVPVGGDVPADNGNPEPVPPADQPDNSVPPEDQPAEPTPAPSEKPQAVATANATAKVIIEKSAPHTMSHKMQMSTAMPAELPTTGPATGAIASGIGLTGLVAATAYYLNSRRELRRTLLKR